MRRFEFFVLDGVEGDVMHVTSDVIIGVAGGLLLIALSVVAVVIVRSLYVARHKRSHDRHTQGSSRSYTATAVIFAARCYAQARPMPSCGVCLSVCHVRGLCRN